MSQNETDKYSHANLEKLYSESEQYDSQIFAEMRSNLLLIAGEHYNRKFSSFFRRLRDTQELSESQKIRLTKNHIQNITKKYVNHVISAVPGVMFSPKVESELQDQKAAELHEAVWQDGKEKYDIEHKEDEWAEDFFGVGEVHTKIFWDPTEGDLIGHRQVLDEEGNLAFDENGMPQLGEPVFSGGFVFEEVYGFNLLRAPEAKTLDKSPYLIIRKMVNPDDLKKKFPDKEKLFTESTDQTMVVFDASKGGYRKSQNECLVKEIYIRPCPDYPNGWFKYWTKEGIFFEDELPGGVFPIASERCERTPTAPRGYSIVKVMRPYQAEINRAASKMAEHQITLGDDKLVIMNGSKATPGASLPGVRTVNVTGAPPTVIAGRDGSQYLAYMTSQIEEMYQVMECDDSDDLNGQVDPYTLLFKAASQKKKNKRYIKRFENFMKKVAQTYIQLAKVHLPEDAVINAIGRKEQINIAEFKNSDELCYQVKVIPQSEDIETKMGKQIALNHLVQYTGANMSKEDLGKLVRLMPYLNMEEGLEDLTIDYDSATNMILALDRGEPPVVSQYDDPTYMIKRLTGRVRAADFKFLAPPIQMAYAHTIQMYEQIKEQQAKALQLAQSGYIPTGGYLVVCDMYVSDPKDPESSKRVRVPYEALRWLIEKLEAQGSGLQDLEQMNQGALAQMAAHMAQNRIQNRGMAAPQPQPVAG